MMHGQYDPSGQQVNSVQHRSQLLQHHPVLIPVILLIGTCSLCVLSFFADTLFPFLLLFGVSASLFCVLSAGVLGIAGVLTGIISTLESIDRRRFQPAMISKAKEQNYVHRH